MKILLALTAVSLLLSAQGAKKPAAGVPEKKLVDTWQTQSIEDSGVKQPADEVRKWSLILRDDGKFTLIYKGGADTSVQHNNGTATFNSSASPKTFEFTFTDGSWKGESFQGIYKLEGDTYTICYVRKGLPVPKTFATKSDPPGQMLVVYKRVKTG